MEVWEREQGLYFKLHYLYRIISGAKPLSKATLSLQNDHWRYGREQSPYLKLYYHYKMIEGGMGERPRPVSKATLSLQNDHGRYGKENIACI